MVVLMVRGYPLNPSHESLSPYWINSVWPKNSAIVN